MVPAGHLDSQKSQLLPKGPTGTASAVGRSILMSGLVSLEPEVKGVVSGTNSGRAKMQPHHFLLRWKTM